MKSSANKKKASIVVGLGYGDEGKGLVTDYLCSLNEKSIVIRYNGGQQAGHTVVNNNGQHIFSNFGSGTLRGVPTYWSSYCTFSPGFFLEEYHILDKVKPKIFIDKLCPITTHYDVLYNRAIESTRGANKHGSCGLGFGATISRQNDSIYFQVQDLFDKKCCIEKLSCIKEYYKTKINNETNFAFSQFDHDLEDQRFIKNIQEIKCLYSNNEIEFVCESDIFSSQYNWQSYIFEGAQGILLDVDFGGKPHTTKSNTTSKNALSILQRNKITDIEVDIFYVTRAYHTRHGAGPFKQHEHNLKLKNRETETNTYNDYQGEFRIDYLDIDLVNYALKCDNKFAQPFNKNLVITCLDQLMTDGIQVYKDGEIILVSKEQLSELLNCDFVKSIFSFSNCTENLIDINL
ncbi:MAG: adenylosuccinate synthetase [Flavipsychrobacter sp.]